MADGRLTPAVASAGDVERFAYCPRNWHLAKEGVAGDGGDGEAEHARLGQAQATVEGQKGDYRRSLNWSFRLLAVAGSATILTLELVYLRAHPQHLVFLVTALVLVSASSGLMAIALDSNRRYRQGQRDAGLVPGRLLSTDLVGTAELLHDDDWGLNGRPDYVLATHEGPVPVEVKTGRTPPTPYPSHVLQVTAYLRLLEATGQAPPYGLVQYPEGVFRVAWDDAARSELRSVLDRMAAGESDRDHEHKARCRGCARRSACDQSLV